jgi:hypothetical protein
MRFSIKQGRSIIIFAPIIFISHFLEESPGFVSWFNSHVRQGITPGLFWSVNITALVITVIITILELSSSSSVSAAVVTIWLSFLMLANSIFHITGAIVDEKYMPGLITAIILYLPYYFFVVARIVNQRRLKPIPLILLALLGSSLMLIHGYLILFRGSRLF